MSINMNETVARRELVRYSHQMHRQGWVANHDGNLSARVEDDRIVCTPTAWSKLDVTSDDLLAVNAEGIKVSGRRRPFSELKLHLGVYRLRADVGAVVHAHPPYASAYGAARRSLPHPFLPEAVVSLGPSIPLVPLTAPGQDALDALSPWVRRCDAVIIAGNGVFAWGPSLELAYLRLELVEHLAKIAHHAETLGGVTRLEDPLLNALLKKRRSAGLSCPEELGGEPPALDPLIQSATDRVRVAFPQATSQEIQRLVTEAIKTVRLS